MRIGFVGNKELASAWELRLQLFPNISQMVFVEEFQFLGDDIDGCIILDPTEQAYTEASIAIRESVPTFLVSRLPENVQHIRRLAQYCEESNTPLQLAHWPSFQPATRWVLAHIKQPALLHLERSLTATEYDVYDNPFRNLWLDELALILKMVPAHALKIDVGFNGDNHISSPRFHLFIRFDDGTTATLFVNTHAEIAVHKRIVSGSFHSAEIDHINRKLTVRELSEAGLRNSQLIQLERDEPADIGLGDFLSTIKDSSQPGYTIFDALKLTETVEMVDRQLSRFS